MTEPTGDPPLTIRPALPGDAEAACAVLRRSITALCTADHGGDAQALDRWLANKTPDNLRRWMADGDIFLAETGGALLGVGGLAAGGVVTLLYVVPEARFRGISKALLARLEARARTLGCRACTLESTRTAERFYRAAGYRDMPSSGGHLWLARSLD